MCLNFFFYFPSLAKWYGECQGQAVCVWWGVSGLGVPLIVKDSYTLEMGLKKVAVGLTTDCWTIAWGVTKSGAVFSKILDYPRLDYSVVYTQPHTQVGKRSLIPPPQPSVIFCPSVAFHYPLNHSFTIISVIYLSVSPHELVNKAQIVTIISLKKREKRRRNLCKFWIVCSLSWTLSLSQISVARLFFLTGW